MTRRTTACAITAALLLAFTSVQSVSSTCDVKPKPGVAPRQYPNIFESYPKGFKLSAEVNDRESKTTMFLTEYFDTRWHQGLLKLTSDGVFTNIYYRNVSEEIFIFDDNSCATVSLKNTPKYLETMALRLNGYTILGASALFIGPSIPGGYKSEYQGQGGNVRGIRTEKWSTCVDNESEPVDIFFAEDPGADLGNATSKAVPVRIQQGKETTDIMVMQPYENDTENKFKIPIGLGCTRLAANLPKPPDLSKVTMEFHSELTFSNPTLKNFYSYMSHLDTIYNTEKQLFSYVMEPWESSAPIKPSLPQDGTQEIWDARNGMVYKQGTLKGRPYCTIEAQSNYSLRVTLPDRNSANMLEVIFLEYDVLRNASYLGRHVVRGIPTETFEISTGELPANVSYFTKAIVTYHYLPARSFIRVSNKSIPVKVAVQTFINQNGKERPHFLLVANIHDISTSMERLNEKLNVQSCYKEDDSTDTWIQIGFPVVDKLVLLLDRGPHIKSAFLEKLFSVSSLSPMRVPRVIVDFTSNMIYLTALILERPNLKGYFMEKKNFGLKVSDWSETAITLDDCLKLCLSGDYNGCSIASYCGASCYTSTTTVADKTTALYKTIGCNAYIRKTSANSETSPLTRDALAAVQDAVERSNFVIYVDAEPVMRLTLVAESMENSIDSFPFASQNMDASDRKKLRRDGGKVEGFEAYSFEYKFKPGSESTLHLGMYPLEDCAAICRDREDCLSFSSCLVSSECSISTTRARNTENVVKAPACSVFDKSFATNFESFEGIALSVTARKTIQVDGVQDCARYCELEKGFNCKSFDYCRRVSRTGDSCRLHETHLTDPGGASRIKSQTADKCVHYSRKYLNDFRKQKSSRVTSDAYTVIAKVSAAQCAKQCREALFFCGIFHFCTGPQDLGRGDCFLHNGDASSFKTVHSPVCSAYTYIEDPDTKSLLARTSALHSNGKAGGLAFFMILLGAGMGVAGVVAFGVYQRTKFDRV